MTLGSRIEPETHWWEASAPTITPNLLPKWYHTLNVLQQRYQSIERTADTVFVVHEFY